MRKNIVLYFLFVLLFVVGKALFLVYHHEVYSAYSLGDCLSALWHGLPHDLTSAGYLMALPFLLEFARIWVGTKNDNWHRFVMRWYLRFALFVVLLNYFADLALYGYWGYRLDSTALIYLQDDPFTALGEAKAWELILFPLLIVVLVWLLQRPLMRWYGSRDTSSRFRVVTSPAAYWSHLQRWLHTLGNVLLCGVLFVLIRGGVTTSTMNIGRVYFSDEMPLNHAATNPFFSFFSTIGKQQRFDRQYRFMSAEEATLAMEELTSVSRDSAALAEGYPHLLRVDRPDIVLIILESFSGSACSRVWAEADSTIMPNLCRLYDEGLGFTNLYANSFRTDRGVASILSAYPGQPTHSVMKDQNKCNNLQHLGKRLKENGYQLRFLHGGDVNFTNMKGYLISGGFEQDQIMGDVDFPLSDRLSKWGVPDHVMFDTLYSLHTTQDSNHPSFTVFLTLSSHEPFDVEYHHFDDPYVNSIAYADSCIGSFVDKLKQTPQWDNTLLILVPDHAFAKYPVTLQNHELLHFRIPMVWVGGALNPSSLSKLSQPSSLSKPSLPSQPSHLVCDVVGQQTDIAASLLGQLGIDHSDFNWSKDLFDPTIPHFAFYSFSDGFGFVTDSCCYIQDNNKDGTPLSGSNDSQGQAQRWGKAYLQTLYDDLQHR